MPGLALLGLIVCAPLSGADAAPDGGASKASPWRALAPGVQSAAAADVGGDPAWAARVVLIDPRHARLSVQFDPARPTLAQWRTRFPEALAIANGSFYSAGAAAGEVRPTCDLVVAGTPLRGAGCRRQDALFFGAVPAGAQRPGEAAERAGMPQPPARAPPPSQQADGGVPDCPTASAEGAARFVEPAEFSPAKWAEAFKSFPALVRHCAPSCAGPHYCRERSRTAALAQLRDGKLLLFASQWPAVRREVGHFLAEALGALDAVNLDGGPEATLSLRGEPLEQAVGMPGTGLPLVLVVVPTSPEVPQQKPRR